MTAALASHLNAMTDSQRNRIARESRKALRLAWPNRGDRRANTVIKANVTMLRNLRSL